MNLQTIQTITLDFTVPRLQNIRCVENDRNSRTVKIFFTNNSSPFPLDRNTMAACYKIHKPDHNYIYNEVPIDPDGTVTIHLSDQAMAASGIARCELQILTKDKQIVLSTLPFSIIVEKSVVTNNDIVSSSESDVLLGMMQHMADRQNPHRITKETVGLGNADNTSDLDKPVSHAARRELDMLTAELSSCLKNTGGSITGNLLLPTQNTMIYGESNTSVRNHALLIGHSGQNYWNFYEYGGIFNFYQSQDNHDTLLGRITENGWEGKIKLPEPVSIFGHSYYGSNNLEGQPVVYGSYNQTPSERFWTSGIQIRENELVGNTKTDIGYAPSIGFHWANRRAATLLFDADDGKFKFRNQDGISRSTLEANLNGNADTATKAEQDGNGRVIANTYLPLTGGTMSGNLYFDNGGAGSGIRKGGNDDYGLSNYNNLDLYSWYGISFSTTISGYACSGKPAVSINTRNGNMYVYDTLSAGNIKLRKGTSNYGSKLNFGDGDYVYLHEFTDDKLEVCANDIYLRTSASGNVYIGDKNSKGTQNNTSLALGKYIALKQPDRSGPTVKHENISLSGYEGYIKIGEIDPGCIDYIAAGHSSSHYFSSYNDNGTYIGCVSIAGSILTCDRVQTMGGDYAEFWEWEDENPSGEDRVGHFVTFCKGKIVLSQKGDHLSKVGVVSGVPSVLGDSDNREWRGKYERDIFGRIIYEEIVCENGQKDKQMKQNPAWDESQTYICRRDRPEWDAVGTHGKLVVIDDGTCTEDGFCVPTDGGIATAAEDGFYVSERLDQNHIRIYMR